VLEKPVWGVVGYRSGFLDSRQTFINFIFINKLVGRSLVRGMDFARQRSNYIINESLVIS